MTETLNYHDQSIVSAGRHTVKGCDRQDAWRKLHKLIARDVLNGDRTLVSLLPESYLSMIDATPPGLRRRLMKHGWLIP